MSSILEKLVENRKMPVLFIGSGISKRYLYKGAVTNKRNYSFSENHSFF